MKANWLTFKKLYWDARSQQERNAFKLAAWALAPVLLYFVLWQPAHNAVQKLHVSVPGMYMAAERLRNHASEVEMLRHRPKPALLDAGLAAGAAHPRRLCECGNVVTSWHGESQRYACQWW